MGECKKGYYTTNIVVPRGPLVCFGGFGQPRCEYLKKCLEENKEFIRPRAYKKWIKILENKK